MTTPLICATVTAPTTDRLVAARDRAAGTADLVELRLDGVRDLDLRRALAGRRTPVLVTCRPSREGGAYQGPEEPRLAILRNAARLGAEYVDVEFDADFAPIVAARSGRGVVLSSHDFGGVPADLGARFDRMRKAGAEVVKVAVTARSLGDNLGLLALAGRAAGAGRFVLVAMGTPGLPSRVWTARFGSCWTYAGDGIAPGQVPPERLAAEFRFRSITAATRLYGVIGRPVGHSVSAAMHNAAFEAVGFDGSYLPLEASDAADALSFADVVGLSGASVTAPFKVAILEGADEVDQDAAACGAANTLRREGGRRAARNTDIGGFLAPLDERGFDLRGARAAVVGTGGAARAVAVALGRRLADVTVYGRRPAEAARVAGIAGGRAGAGTIPAAGSWDLLVNATPVGTRPDVAAGPVPPEALRGGRAVYDLVYNPARTALLDAAREAGCETIGGLEMLVAQAVAQFEWWTGKPAPRDVMRDAAEASVRRMGGAA